MRRTAFFVFALAITFCLGFAVKTVTIPEEKNDEHLKRVTGIGGVFFKCKNPKKMREWYRAHLGLQTNEYGAVFEWRQGADTAKKGFTQWAPFADESSYFDGEFMINYRVKNLDLLVEALRREGVAIVDDVQTYDYGKFVHILDVEGNKIELWEPNDVAFEELGNRMGAKTTK